MDTSILGLGLRGRPLECFIHFLTALIESNVYEHLSISFRGQARIDLGALTQESQTSWGALVNGSTNKGILVTPTPKIRTL